MQNNFNLQRIIHCKWFSIATEIPLQPIFYFFYSGICLATDNPLLNKIPLQSLQWIFAIANTPFFLVVVRFKKARWLFGIVVLGEVRGKSVVFMFGYLLITVSIHMGSTF